MPLDPDLFKLYLVAAAVLIVIPGPDTLLVMTRSLDQGRGAGLVATAGITTGNIAHASAAAAGISALVAASPTLFGALRLAGALYLAWIGVQALRGAWRTAAEPAGGSSPRLPAARGGRVFVHALFTNLLNVKVLIFYLAFVPQFVAPAAGRVGLQILLLGLTLAGAGGLYFVGLTAVSAGIGRRLLGSSRVRAALDGIAGLLFLGFAVQILLTQAVPG